MTFMLVLAIAVLLFSGGGDDQVVYGAVQYQLTDKWNV